MPTKMCSRCNLKRLGYRLLKLRSATSRRTRDLNIVVVIAILTTLLPLCAFGQVENVPISNQVYEFLDRMGVKGVVPMYSSAMVPMSRREVAQFLVRIGEHRDRLNAAELGFLRKFLREFAHEIDPSMDDASILLRGGSVADLFSDRQTYLYRYSDSVATASVEVIGSLETRTISGGTFGERRNVSLEEHGGRIRGTVGNWFGFFVQGTDGTIFGNKEFARTDTRLRGNWKLESGGSTNFDFTEAYVRTDWDWIGIEFGREYARIGTGYSDRLILSDQPPLMDMLRLDARYKSFRMTFIHGSIVDDSVAAVSLTFPERIEGPNKYLALHRFQFALFDRLNVGVSEMVVYRRASPEFAYVNPINFYKSAEHAQRDRDNALLAFDCEFFPAIGYKLYGAWLIDDLDFSKMGTGWWGNEFAWQGGAYIADVAGLQNIDAVIEYTRIEPYVYSNRMAGLSYTHNNIGMGNHLEPNSDEWFVQTVFRPVRQFRAWLGYARTRHGENSFDANGYLVRNVGGSALHGHRDTDSEFAHFLDGNLVKTQRLQLRAMYEPWTNIFVGGQYEHRWTKRDAPVDRSFTDDYASIRVSYGY
jgi:hypothetical protein